ncbi:hypothetical protein BKA63DRAFT_413147 [Paraphoma chrysanthemicola]|nr:hypothetical protein BKA63DRAFT_413147 [Paraphoma chrysanthemicola]
MVLTGTDETEVPSIIIVARSSSTAPDGWKAGMGTFDDGLPVWGRKILEHYVAYSRTTAVGKAILHAAANAKTRHIPAADEKDSHLELSETLRWEKHVAWKFTQAITDDIIAANEAGVEPILLSVGIDGFTCSTKMLEPWLSRGHVRFRLALRLTTLDYGITDSHIDLHHKVYWGNYDVNVILKHLQDNSAADDKTHELIQAWKLLQYAKDNCAKAGRNTVDLSASFSPLEL